MMMALDAGADDVIASEEGFEVLTSPENFRVVFDAIVAEKIEILSGEVTQVPQTSATLNEEDSIAMEKMLDQLEDDDDVQHVYHNWESED